MTNEDAAAIRDTGGNLSAIAHRLGIERSEVVARMETDAAFRAAVDNERERMIDTLEGRLISAAAKGDLKSAARLLRIIERPARRENNERGYIFIFRELAKKRIEDRRRKKRERRKNLQS